MAVKLKRSPHDRRNARARRAGELHDQSVQESLWGYGFGYDRQPEIGYCPVARGDVARFLRGRIPFGVADVGTKLGSFYGCNSFSFWVGSDNFQLGQMD